MFRMSQTIFLDLLNELECIHGLHGSSRTTSREVLAMTLYISSHNESIRSTCEWFQHSTETVSRYFSIGLEALVKLSCSVIKPIDPEFCDTIIGKYYVVDDDYPMQRGFLKPFSYTKYHIPGFERGSQLVRGRQEAFNKRHSSLRGVIERSFVVWKKK
ncbi:hypothetical protein MA16_Dca016101 [Dendrobium catenatum]|uniref:DUF8040 domain-containing protein n=1 Tax=Dendrobium catenatum TaxID=906689 RepID=A0A2I0WIY0_9ASPA|nr:hypothetical protein MA16_Dca016101 [Dendrobium catenatum]